MSLKQLGRYEITGTLGRGAMGTVYRARDPLIERTVAIKTVDCGALSGNEADEFEQRFFREAKSAGGLNHPNIVTIHDVGREGELAWIAMECLTGGSLRDLLDANTLLTPARAVEIVAAVADALAYAHAQGIVHRDVKPANIVVLDNGTVKLADFGIAQLPGSGLTTVGTILGSPKYMSPEQVAGLKADGRADIFSLGAVLYELLAGQPPFDGGHPHATMFQVVHETPPPPSERRPDLPAAFDAIVRRALAKAPEDRYQDAADMARELRRAISGDPVAPSNTEPAARPSHGGRGKLIVGALALAGMAIFAATSFLLPSQVSTPQPSAPPNATAPPASASAAILPKTSPPEAEKPAEPATPVAGERVPPKKTPRPATPATKPGDAPADWRSALQADLKACETQSVFSRVMCVEKARWKHCPGHWGEIADCPSSTGEKPRTP